METPKNTPLPADEIIARVEKKGGRRLSKNIRIMIRILSEEALSRKNLGERLRNHPDYDCQGANNDQIGQRAAVLRYHGILGCQDGKYHINGSKTDPTFQEIARLLPIRKSEEKRSLRSIVYEILKQTPLPAGGLVRKVASHPDYDGSYGTGKKLKTAAHSVLNGRKNRCFFERDGSRLMYADWRVKAGSSPPPRKARQMPCPKQDAVYELMRSRSIIKGWTCRDLFEELSGSESGYISLESAQTALNRVFRRDEKKRFELVSLERPWHWRAKWLGPLKIPSCPKEFLDLAGRILDDLMLPHDFEDLLVIIRQHSHLFGYQTNELPLSFLRVEMIRAIAGTKYSDQVR